MVHKPVRTSFDRRPSVGSMQGMVNELLDGHGIVLRSEWDVAGYLRSSQLVRLLEPWLGSSADIHAVYPQRHQLDARVRAFVDFVALAFQQQAAAGRA